MAQDDLQSGYRTRMECLKIQTRLLCLPGFALYSGLLNEADPVASIRGLFALGIPLCHLFNLLPHRLYPIRLDYTLQNDEYKQRIAIAQFALRCNQAFGCPHFSITDVLDPEAIYGFDKALNAVSAVLDQLCLNEIKGPTKQFGRAPSKAAPYKDDSEVYLRTGSDYIKELLDSERKYVMQMETLEKFSDALAAVGTLSPKTVSLVFPKKLFIFARKFRIQLESIAQLPWPEQNWGAPFVTHTMDIDTNMRIHCVNCVLIKPALAQLDMGSLQVPAFKVSSESVAALLAVPLNHLSDYLNYLNKIIPISAAMNHAHHDELTVAVACVKRGVDRAIKAQKKAISDQICETLKRRIADWQGLEISTLGQVVLESNLLTRRNDILQRFDVFLFENELVLCDETLPPPPSISRIGRRKSVSYPPLYKESTLYIKDHFLIQNTWTISMTEFRRVQDNGSSLLFELAISMGTFTVSLLYLHRKDMQKWCNELRHIQQLKSKGEDRNDIYLYGHPTPVFSEDIFSQSRHPRKRSATHSGALTRSLSQSPGFPIMTSRRCAFVKLHFGSNTSVLSMDLPVTFDTLIERIDKKLRYSQEWCGERRLITHWTDNGDIVLLGRETALEYIFQEGVMVSLHIEC